MWKETDTRVLSSHHVRHSKKATSQEECSPENNHLRLSASRTVRHKFLLLSHPAHAILLWQPEHSKIMIVFQGPLLINLNSLRCFLGVLFLNTLVMLVHLLPLNTSCACQPLSFYSLLVHLLSSLSAFPHVLSFLTLVSFNSSYSHLLKIHLLSTL